MVAPPGKVVDADDRKRLMRHLSPASDNPQQCVVADRQHQTLRKAGGGTPAKRQPQMVDDVLHPTGAPRAAAKNIRGEAFCKDLLAAQDGITSETTHRHEQADPVTRQGQIRWSAQIPAVDTTRDSPT